MKFEDVKKQE